MKQALEIDKKTNGIINGKFDLGYILRLSDGSEAQLRALEMKGETLDYHRESREEDLFGTSIDVYIIFRSNQGIIVSELSPKERKHRDRKTETNCSGSMQNRSNL